MFSQEEIEDILTCIEETLNVVNEDLGDCKLDYEQPGELELQEFRDRLNQLHKKIRRNV